MEGYNKVLLEFNQTLQQINQQNPSVGSGGSVTSVSATLPVVITDSATGGLYNFSADGTVVSDGGSPVTHRGFVVSNTQNPTTPANLAYLDVDGGLGVFECNNQATPGFIVGTVYVRAFATNAIGTAYGVQLTVTVYICLVEGTLVTLIDGIKPIEDIEYDDDLLVWNFDDAKFDSAKPLYIKKPQVTDQYNLLEFSDGSHLKTIVQHRIFNKQAGKFTYPMTEDTPIGTITFNVKGEETVLIKKSVVKENVRYYNVITNYHMNLFGNGILTSLSYNNLYPIKDMKFIKDNRDEIPMSEYVGISEKYYYGLRLSEQVDIPVENTIKYITVREPMRKPESESTISHHDQSTFVQC